MPENMSFPVPNDVLRPFIQEAISVSICAALGDGVRLVEAAVQAALMTKVNSDGVVDSRYSSDNKYLLVDVLARKKIQEIARETINEMAEQMRPKIKEEIEKQLKTKHKQIAQTLIDGMIGSLTSRWAITVNLEGKRD